MDPHHLAEETSLALHGAVAERLAQDPALVARARERVRCWLAEGAVARPYAEGWRDLLDGPLDGLCAFLEDDGERARAFRQVSPFAGVLDPRERWRIWRAVRRAGASP